MNILRKTLILPILVLISGCGTKEQEPERKDSISLTSSEVTIDHAAQTLEVTVSSSETWTISAFSHSTT